jgi:response regulator of citrate/malate metabolism
MRARIDTQNGQLFVWPAGEPGERMAADDIAEAVTLALVAGCREIEFGEDVEALAMEQYYGEEDAG